MDNIMMSSFYLFIFFLKKSSQVKKLDKLD